MLKISYKVLESISGKNRRGRVRRGYCQVCGAKLSDPKSIERGIGKHCLANNVAIILEFVPDNAPNTVCTPTNGGLSQADNLSTPAAICG